MVEDARQYLLVHIGASGIGNFKFHFPRGKSITYCSIGEWPGYRDQPLSKTYTTMSMQIFGDEVISF
jgi:hypothetical protein